MTEPGKKNRVRSLVNISVAAIALSLTIMILAVGILVGFKKEIKQKISGFSAHIQLSVMDGDRSMESSPFPFNDSLMAELQAMNNVETVYPLATKPALLKSGTDIQGVILNGIDHRFDDRFLKDYLIRGKLPDLNDSLSLDIMISEDLARLLKRDTGDRMPAYIIEDPPRMRPFRVSGVYKTGLAEYDRRYVFCHLNQIRTINGWTNEQTGALAIMLHDSGKMDEAADRIRASYTFVPGNNDEILEVKTIRNMAPGFFDFLSLTDTNVLVILVLMLLVAGFNMTSGLLILILDRTRMIGILRAMGASVKTLQKVFLYQAAWIIGKGLIIGNFIGLLLGWIQQRFEVLALDPESYFVDAVPIHFSFNHILLLNAGTLVITMIMLMVPSRIISKLSPEKTIKFD